MRFPYAFEQPADEFTTKIPNGRLHEPDRTGLKIYRSPRARQSWDSFVMWNTQNNEASSAQSVLTKLSVEDLITGNYTFGEFQHANLKINVPAIDEISSGEHGILILNQDVFVYKKRNKFLKFFSTQAKVVWDFVLRCTNK
ncbi:hypothetical protein EDC01DRAFT_634149 [Geopyxis carbonaria]|nr:hypothetical protein EDC01DRAFT_634149 [Geopyxis carbonaria]